jgi:hypothetical protein
MNLSEMSKDERSLLLYIESCATDYAGLVHAQRINDDDRKTLARWNKDGFISYSRLSFASIEKLGPANRGNTSLVRLSEDAWKLAHEERRARNLRMSSKEPYCSLITTKTKNSNFVSAEGVQAE